MQGNVFDLTSEKQQGHSVDSDPEIKGCFESSLTLSVAGAMCQNCKVTKGTF